MNLRQIELFVAIAEAGSFSRGADRVSLTQSTASQHMATLEDEMGTGLFDRVGRGVLLTSGGEKFLLHARRILSERDALLQSMIDFRGLGSTLLKIGASNIPANYLIPPMLVSLKENFPGITLNMITGDTHDIVARLEQTEIELAVVGNRLTSKKVEFVPLTTDSLVLIVGPKHRWRNKDFISLHDLLSEPIVIREEGSGSGQTFDNVLRLMGQNPADLKVAARLGNNEAVLQAVASGFGCAFVSELSVKYNLASGALYKVEVKDLAVDRQIWIAKLKARSDSPAALAFKEALVSHYQR
ncbi:MAG: LysR family transcriptional regulator [Deltaproteobacteria bacterium]|nr:MAG: LysR family transcriptional regulator [Deltaproteobacteria bacterium]